MRGGEEIGWRTEAPSGIFSATVAPTIGYAPSPCCIDLLGSLPIRLDSEAHRPFRNYATGGGNESFGWPRIVAPCSVQPRPKPKSRPRDRKSTRLNSSHA